jgi:hypothetical protein
MPRYKVAIIKEVQAKDDFEAWEIVNNFWQAIKPANDDSEIEVIEN